MDNRLLAGTTKVDITPPLGYLLQGHAIRNKPSKRVHDQLGLKVVSISKESERMVLVSCDLLCFTKDFVEDARAEITEKTGLLPHQVLLCCSHTHTGPFTLDLLGSDPRNFVPEYLSIVKKKIAGAVIESMSNQEPVKVKYGRANVDMGIINRRRKNPDGTIGGPDPTGFIDYEVSVLSFERDEGDPLAILFNYGCHPTTLSADIYEVSADYPGAAQKEIEGFYYKTNAIFTNGCLGDVRPALLDEEGRNFRGGSFEDMRRMGRLLASGAIQARETSVLLNVEKLETRLEKFSFNLDRNFLFQDKQTLEDNFLKLVYKFRKTYKPLESEIRWKNFWLDKINRKEVIPQDIIREIHLFKIGGVSLVGLPGETVAEIGLKIKQKLKNAFTIGLSNGYLSYIPSATTLKEGGYEASLFFYQDSPGPFSVDMEEKLLDKIFSMVEK